MRVDFTLISPLSFSPCRGFLMTPGQSSSWGEVEHHAGAAVLVLRWMQGWLRSWRRMLGFLLSNFVVQLDAELRWEREIAEP